MKRVVIHSTNFNSFWAHYSFYNDKYFYNRFKELGYELVLSNQVEIKSSDYIIFFEAKSLNSFKYNFRHLLFKQKLKFVYNKVTTYFGSNKLENVNFFKRFEKINSKKNIFLLILEGKIDAPENHWEGLAKSCKAFFTWNDEIVDNSKIIKINWPQPLEWPNVESIPFEQKKMLTNISANKYSNNKIELYSERRKAIHFFEKKLNNQFDLYGLGWNKPATFMQKNLKVPYPIFKSYRGVVDSKAEVFSKYRFALIYENACIPGWITEKVFDCLRSKCIPIYLGAPNISDYLPDNIFIDRRLFKSNDELLTFLLDFDQSKYNEYMVRISEYLKSEDFKKHLSISLVDIIVHSIENKA